MPISILSWNILGPATRDVQDYGFIKGDYGRLGQTLELVSSVNADILFFQEIDLTALHLFNNFLLPNYIQAAYHEKGAHGGVALYVKKSKFKIISTVASVLKNSQNDAPGAFCGAIIENFDTGKFFFVASVHLSKSCHHEAVSEGIYQISDLCSQLEKNIAQIILAGDFNTMYDDMRTHLIPRMSEMLGKKLVMFEHELCTENSTIAEFQSLDHILYANLSIDMKKSCVFSGKYFHAQQQILQTKGIDNHHEIISTKLPSDHAPIFAVFE